VTDQPQPKPTVHLFKPPKAIADMTDDELDAFAGRVANVLFDEYEAFQAGDDGSSAED
jgi:hypothetical protein